jgi:hypothetical protein
MVVICWDGRGWKNAFYGLEREDLSDVLVEKLKKFDAG